MPSADMPKHSSSQTTEINKKLSKEVKTQPVTRGELDQLKAAVRPAPPPVILQLSSHLPRQVLNTHRTISLPLLSQDDSFPLTNTSRNKFVEQLLNSMRNIREADDSISSTRDFKTRWLKPGLKGEYIYDELDMERVIYDPSTIEKILASKPLSFEDRISRLAYLMRKSKARCDMFMLGNTLEDTVALIATKVTAQKSNATNNPSRSARLQESKKILGLDKRTKRSKLTKSSAAPSDTSKSGSKVSENTDNGTENLEFDDGSLSLIHPTDSVHGDRVSIDSPMGFSGFSGFSSAPADTSSALEFLHTPIEHLSHFNDNLIGTHAEVVTPYGPDSMSFAGLIDLDSNSHDFLEPSVDSANFDMPPERSQFKLNPRMPQPRNRTALPRDCSAVYLSDSSSITRSNKTYMYPPIPPVHENVNALKMPDIFWEGTGDGSFDLAEVHSHFVQGSRLSPVGSSERLTHADGDNAGDTMSPSKKRPRRKQPAGETVNSILRGHTAPRTSDRRSYSRR
ncbi:hypothetical protein N0V94_004008 [Neodidymelliopsis sp. IMI 364377]|nr:hypothetical protein N0V94_004008 [Neodidymelliopsis sp. IMI 364377]